MIRQVAFGTVFLGLTACATSPPEQATAAAYSGGSAGTVATTASASNTSAGAVPVTAVASSESGSGDGLHVVEVPTVAKTTHQPARAEEPHKDELICRREKTTGSHRVTRVCRTREQVEMEREAGQSMVQNMSREAR